MRVVSDLTQIDARDWDALVFASPAPTPFMRHAFLHALHETGCASRRTGWEPQFLTLWQGARLCAGVPLYRSLDELQATYPDCMVRAGEGRALIDALFPKAPSDVWPLV